MICDGSKIFSMNINLTIIDQQKFVSMAYLEYYIKTWRVKMIDTHVNDKALSKRI